MQFKTCALPLFFFFCSLHIGIHSIRYHLGIADSLHHGLGALDHIARCEYTGAGGHTVFIGEDQAMKMCIRDRM